MIKKIIQIFICACYWLCIVPCVVYTLYKENVIHPDNAWGYFTQYSILFFVFILVYLLIHHIFDKCYMKHEIRKRVRKITIKRQLERLERGEISLDEAQDFKTFTNVKSPKSKRKCPPGGNKGPIKKLQSGNTPVGSPRMVRRKDTLGVDSPKLKSGNTPVGSPRMGRRRDNLGVHVDSPLARRHKPPAAAIPSAAVPATLPPSYSETVRCDPEVLITVTEA